MKRVILEEAHKSSLSIHPGATKMYQDLKKMFWWPGLKRDVVEYVMSCLVCQKAKVEHQKPAGLLKPLSIPEWKWDCITMAGKVNGTVLANHRLIIDTTTIPYGIKQVDALGNLISDMYQQSDFSTSRFVRFGHGRNTVTFGADNTNVLKVGVEAEIEYATI